MQHHNYPAPAPEHLAYIQDARRRNVAEQDISLALTTRGLTAQEIADALAPGCVICDIAEQSHEKIRLYSPTVMTLYGVLLGYPVFWYMAWRNTHALRGNDRMMHRLRRFGFLFLCWVILCIAVLGGPLRLSSVRDWLPSVLVTAVSIVAVLFMRIRVMVYHLPFRMDAQQRDECARADVMIPFLFGVLWLGVLWYAVPCIMRVLG
jgi:hypothetical protein